MLCPSGMLKAGVIGDPEDPARVTALGMAALRRLSDTFEEPRGPDVAPATGYACVDRSGLIEERYPGRQPLQAT